MKIAIPAKTIEDEIEEKFGRCNSFLIIENNKTKTLKNTTEGQGNFGPTTAKLLADNNITTIIVKNIGPKALDVLKQFNITILKFNGKAKDAIKNIKNLEELK